MADERWTVVENAAWTTPPAEPLTESACHDHSHLITIQCACGEHMHLHESQTRAVPQYLNIATVCKGCGEVLTLTPGYIADTFSAMRRQGWIS